MNNSPTLTPETPALSAQPPVQPSWRIQAVDGLRALAITMIFGYHAWQFAGSPKYDFVALGRTFDLFGFLPLLRSRVDLFMVLSGFCLFLPVCKPGGLEKWSTPGYFRRRLRRIVPPYYAAIVFSMLLPHFLVLIFRAAGQTADSQPWPSWFQIATHLTFTHTLWAETFFGLQEPLWSMGLEMQFYVAFPLLVWGYRHYGMRAVWAAIGISILYRVGAALWMSRQDPPLTFDQVMTVVFFFPGRWMQFAAGMAAAYYVVGCRSRDFCLSARQGAILLLAAVAGFALAESSWTAKVPLLPVRDSLVGLSFALAFVALCASQVKARAFFENKTICSLGFISYSIFLIHAPIGWFFTEFLRRKLGLNDPVLLFGILITVGFAVVVGCSYIFFLIFERPFLNNAPRARRDGNASDKIVASSAPVAPLAGAGVPIVEDQSAP